MNKIKNEKGSLSLFVVLAMIFFMTFIMALYMSTTNDQKTQLAITARIKQTYEQNIDDESLNEIYNSFIGTDEYIPIYTIEQLKKVGTGESVYIEEIGKYYTFNLDSNYILKRNIDLNKGKYTVGNDGTITFTNATQWTPIGATESTAFSGIFDGNNHTISGLYINDTTKSNQAFFGYVSGTIKNLGIDSGNVTGGDRTAGLVGYINNGTIERCYNKAIINGTGYEIGGLCGVADGTTILQSYNSGNVTGNINQTYGVVSGIVGRQYNVTNISECYNSGNITSISSEHNTRACGITDEGGIVLNCYNTGNILNRKNGTQPGCVVSVGITGQSPTSITNCYNVGVVTVEDKDITTYYDREAAITGYCSSNDVVSNCYWLESTSNCGIPEESYLVFNTSDPSQSKTEEYMKSNEFVNDLGSDKWKIVEGRNNGYPILSWE